MPPEEHRFIRRLMDEYNGLFTPVGRMMLWTALAAGIMLGGGIVPPLVLFFAFCASALIVSVLMGWPFRPRVKLSRRLPPPVSAGEKLTYRVMVENVGKRPLRQVVVEERGLPPDLKALGEPPVLEVLNPGERAEVTLQLQCALRGAYELGTLQAASLFPSALVKVPRRLRTKDRLLVYPRFSALEGFEVPHGRNYQPGGIAVASQVGESSEFFGTRDFRDGDRTRDIHWPSFARTGRLIVKEFQEEYFVRLAMVLDIESRSAKEDKYFEKSLSLAASLADVLARKEYIIDLFAAGPEIFHFQAGRALAHFEHILEILACLDPGNRLNLSALEATLLPEAAQLSAVIFVVMDWEPGRAELVRKLREHGVAVRVISVRPDRAPTGLEPGEWVELR